MPLFFDKEADDCLALFSAWDLPESDESDGSEDDDDDDDDDFHGRLPDGEASVHEGTDIPIFMQGAENQGQK